MIKFLDWSDELNVGIEELDEQHRALVDLINQIYDAMHRRNGGELVEDILNQLLEATRIHFAVEESLMRVLDYPQYVEHKAQHARLLEHLSGLTEGVATGEILVNFELLHELKVWLVRHIQESDRPYGEHFLAAGVNPKLKRDSWVERIWEHLH